MNFIIFKDFLNFYEFKIDFISAQVTWRNLEHPIAHLIVIVDRHLKGRGTCYNLIRRRIVLK